MADPFARARERDTDRLLQAARQQKAGEDLAGGEEQDKRTAFVLTHYNVFNVEQCDGLTVPEKLPGTQPDENGIDRRCEALVRAWTVKPQMEVTQIGEQRAYCRPAANTVHMLARFCFLDSAFYYSSLFHELVHSTGHDSRLNRSSGASFGDEPYSREELVAEMGSAFLCALTDIGSERTDRNTTAYLQNWIEQLTANNRLVLHAAAAAAQCSRFVAFACGCREA